jgi:hypothetical protein
MDSQPSISSRILWSEKTLFLKFKCYDLAIGVLFNFNILLNFRRVGFNKLAIKK